MREIAQNRLYRIGYHKNYTIKGRTLNVFRFWLHTTEDVLRASFIFNRANMHLQAALCMHFVIISISPFSSQLLGEIRSNKNCPGCLDSLESRAGWYFFCLKQIILYTKDT